MRQNLTRTIRDRTGRTIRNRTDAKTYVLRQLERKPGYKSWRRAAQLLVDRAGEEAITDQIEFALFHDCAIDMKHWMQQLRQ